MVEMTADELRFQLAWATVPVRGPVDEWGTETMASNRSEWPRDLVFKDMLEDCPCGYNDWDRHECWPCYRMGGHILVGERVCKRCKGRGKVPVTDGWAWLDSLPLVFIEFFDGHPWSCRIVLTENGDYGADVIGKGKTKEDALYGAFWEYVSQIPDVRFPEVA